MVSRPAAFFFVVYVFVFLSLRRVGVAETHSVLEISTKPVTVCKRLQYVIMGVLAASLKHEVVTSCKYERTQNKHNIIKRKKDCSAK